MRETLAGHLGSLGPPVQVVWHTVRCQACGARGDRRLLPRHCHMEAELRHPGTLQQRHPGQLQPHHPTQVPDAAELITLYLYINCYSTTS